MGTNYAYEAYQEIQSLVKEIMFNGNVNRKVFLISTKSIPKYANILMKYKALNLDIKLTDDELNKMKKEFDDYKFEKSIEILSKYGQIQNFINSEDDNDIIIVDITFFEKMHLNLKNIFYQTVTLIKIKNNMEIKFDDSKEILEFKQKNNGLFKIFKDSKKEKLYETYQNIKSIINKIFDEKNFNADVFLISAKSIPKFIKILNDLDALNPKKDLNVEKIEKMNIMFLEYKLEKNIQIIYELNQLNGFINSEENNEFIFASISFLKGMKIDLEQNFYKTVNLEVHDNSIEIKFKNSNNALNAQIKNNRLFKLVPKEDTIEKKEEKEEEDDYEEVDEESENEFYYSNDISDIVSFFDCLKGITKLKNYFLENKNLLVSEGFDGVYSLIFYDFLTTKDLENCIKNIIQEIKDFSDHLSLINTFYDEIHFELNKKGNKKKGEKNYQSDNLQDLILYFRDDFENNNKSIISDIFYFEKINILRCYQCKTILYRIENINKLIFNVEEVRNYKSTKCEGFDSLNILDCLHYFGHQKNNNTNNCNHCGNDTFETLSTKINSPPEILTIILHYKENFNDDIIFDIYPEKDSENLSINIDFSIFNWGENNMTEKIEANYNLIGFCSYYNIKERYCRPFYLGEDNKWYLHDTDEIIEVSLKEKDKGNPYFLFYQRISN